MHFYNHYIKFINGRFRFNACHAVININIERDADIPFSKRYQGKLITYLKDCLNYLGITKEELILRIDQARSLYSSGEVESENIILIQVF